MLGNGNDLHTDGTASERTLNPVPLPHFTGRFGCLAIDFDMGAVTRLIGDGTPLDQARHFQVFIQSHKFDSPCRIPGHGTDYFAFFT